MKNTFTWLGFLWTNRSGNAVAELLAKLAASRSLPLNWVTAPPRSLAVLIDLDALAH